MRILLIGDIVGKPGRKIVVRSLKGLIQRERLDLVIANAENVAAGAGITPANYQELIAAGLDGITLGDHIYRRKEIAETLTAESNIVKPANFPASAPGRDHMILTARNGVSAAAFCVLGRVFMRPVNCPFEAADRVLARLPQDIKVIIVDCHAEATSDMQLMGRHLDGRVTAVLGTHTHVATADERIFPGGTAFQCDVGMTGPHESILGRRIDRVLRTTRTFHPTHFDVATDDVRLCGTVVELDAASGRATAIERISVDEAEADELAATVEPDAR